MVWGAVLGTIAGGLLSNRSGDRAADAADREGARADAAEQQRFEEAKRQAEILRQRGDEAAAVAMEEAARAELGAQKFEALSNEYARRADAAAARRESIATNLYSDIQAQARDRQRVAEGMYDQINTAADARQSAGLAEQQNILGAARGNEQLQRDVFGNIKERFTPFMDSERQAIGQLGAEMGLSPGERFTGYRESPAYTSAQDASRVAEQEAIGAIDQAAGNTGTLYSGTRGAALLDRAKRGSYERAGIEQSYYQNYMNMLQGMANPAATAAVSGYETGMANNIGSTNTNAAMAGSDVRMNSMRTGGEGMQLFDQMRTGAEGAELMAYLDPGTAGAAYTLNGFNDGMAGTPYRLGAQDYRLQGAGGSGSMIMSSMPTGTRGSDYRLAGVEAENAMMSDLISGGANIYSNYLKYGNRKPAQTSAGGTYNLGPYG